MFDPFHIVVAEKADLLLHRLVHDIGHTIGAEAGANAPAWVHHVMHLVLLWAPAALLTLVAFSLSTRLWRRYQTRRGHRACPKVPQAIEVQGFEHGIYRYILRWSRRQQLLLIILGLTSMPVLYATLELPKLIVNNAIESGHFPVSLYGLELDQLAYLYMLCGLYLGAVLLNGGLKLVLNIYKGRVGERVLRRLRLTIYRRWREGAGSERRGEVTPIIAQEVEPMGGFASDAFAVPIFQGGVFLTILVFMFAQDPILGAAALALLPVQLALIPRLQQRVNRLARQRVAAVRSLGGQLGEEAGTFGSGNPMEVGRTLKRIESIRQKIHRAKFLMKALTNFLTALTPFFFYSIGGYLVIEGRLSLGALVAVLAAYKDFSAPLRELFRYYQQSEDVRIRYTEMLNYLSLTSIKKTQIRSIRDSNNDKDKIRHIPTFPPQPALPQ
jgi:ABC-type multidrug transport system fused ATPase/permease subunit